MPSEADLTRLLQQWRSGDRGNEAQLFQQIYPMLRTIAGHRLREGQVITMKPKARIAQSPDTHFCQIYPTRKARHWHLKKPSATSQTSWMTQARRQLVDPMSTPVKFDPPSAGIN